MKPLRGSNRDASNAPTSRPKGKRKKIDKEETRQNKVKKNQGPVANASRGKSGQVKTGQNRKAESPLQPPSVKGQENWKQMSGSSITELGQILDLSVLATLAQKKTNKKEVQEHLNGLKKRFLEHCSTLKVPGHKQKPESAALLHEETKKSEAEKQTLNALEENLRAVVNTLEKNEGEMNVLEHQCSVLRSRKEDQEEESVELFQRKEAVLNLSLLQPTIDETTLEDKMRRAVPDSEAETMARKLSAIIQSPGVLQDAQELLSLAHRQVDELFNLHPVPLTHK